MSQAWLDNDTILTGYDRPLRRFFVTIFKHEEVKCEYCVDLDKTKCVECDGTGIIVNEEVANDFYGTGYEMADKLAKYAKHSLLRNKLIECYLMDLDPEDIRLKGVLSARGVRF